MKSPGHHVIPNYIIRVRLKRARVSYADQIVYQRNLTALRTQLGEAVFQSGSDEGRALTMVQATEIAMNETE